MTPAVSVVLPVYNAGPPLHTAIRSILGQQECAFEFLILDDGSTDGSRAVAQAYASQDERVRLVLHSRNQGLAATLNEGLHLARAPLVARMDQDDEALPHRLSAQAAFMEAHPHISVAGSFVYHMGARRAFDRLIQLPADADAVRSTLEQYNCLYHPAVVLRREPVLASGGYRADFVNAEDYELWLRLSRDGAVCNMPQPLLRYRFSPGGMTLGRKWEQLYYVYLAQATHVGPESPRSPALAQARAAEMLAQTDRHYFFGEVAKGTIDELLRLRLRRDALRVFRVLRPELRREQLVALAKDLVRRRVSPA